MEIEHFDTDLFIDEIQKRPAIWDMQSPDYKNKILKKRNWEEIVEIFSDCEDNLEKKKLLDGTLMKKWKSIRDNYLRESKRQKSFHLDLDLPNIRHMELKKVPENRRLTTKIELLNVIKEAQNYHQSLPLETNHHQYTYSTPTYSGYTAARPSTTQQWSTTPPPPPSSWSPSRSASSQDSDNLDLFE
ncbi:unnamed protein product [Parnassius mnemosyne]|uniref:MADF domain-containing protein n=1 Tax=Parnassius mnemosyne TaxID=213953 RepID=A0AAV1M8R2_9NEOP